MSADLRGRAAFLPLLRGRAGWRRMVLTASSAVFVPGVRLGAYQASKFVVWGLRRDASPGTRR